jgi:hypothetical protein
VGPARMFAERLTPIPGIREQNPLNCGHWSGCIGVRRWYASSVANLLNRANKLAGALRRFFFIDGKNTG